MLLQSAPFFHPQGKAAFVFLSGPLQLPRVSKHLLYLTQHSTPLFITSTMAKTKSNRRRGGSKQRGSWSNADHDARTANRIASLNKKRRRRQTAQEEDLQHQEEVEEQSQQITNIDRVDVDHDELPADRSTKRPRRQQQQPHDDTTPPLHKIPPKRSSSRQHIHRLSTHVPTDTYKRTHLAHDSYEQIDSSKLRLATAQIQRRVNALRERLQCWDPVAEREEAARLASLKERGEDDKSTVEYRMRIDAENLERDKLARDRASSEYNLLYAKHGVNSSVHRRKANLKRKKRGGPEGWKLRGAAR